MKVALLIVAGGAALLLVIFLVFVIGEVRRSGWRVFRTRMGRSSKVWRLALRRTLRFLRLRRRASAEQVDAFHLQTAEQVFEMMGGMKGAVMKLGQLVSILGDSLPEQYQQVLQGLQQSAPPMSYELAAGVVEEELGGSPDEVFAEFTREPVASASIGQVHRARLPDGTEVAVKVQYPGVDVAIRADLDNMFLLTNVARMLAPGVDPEGLVNEMKSVMFDELDYRKEAAHQSEFGRAYEGHPWIRIPRVHEEFSARRVLTSEWVEGRSFYEIVDAPQHVRDRVGEQLFRFFVGSVGRLRFFNADPHPGNYFFADDDTIWFLDFGMVKRFDAAVIDRLREQIVALRSGDHGAIRSAMVRHGWFAEDADLDMDRVVELAQMSQRSLAGPDPFTFTRDYTREVIQSVMDVNGPYGDIIRNLTLPPDHVMLNRIQMGVTAVLGRLEATGAWAAIYDEYMLGAPPATPMGEEARAWPRPVAAAEPA